MQTCPPFEFKNLLCFTLGRAYYLLEPPLIFGPMPLGYLEAKALGLPLRL